MSLPIFRRSAPPLGDDPIDRLVKALLVGAVEREALRITISSDRREKLATLLTSLGSKESPPDDGSAVVVFALPSGTSHVESILPARVWPTIRDRIVALAGGIAGHPREDAGELEFVLESHGALQFVLHWRRDRAKETLILERLRGRSN